MVALPQEKLLLLEIRDETSRQVSFSAYQFEHKTFLWKDLILNESWWVGLLAANRSIVLIQNYSNQDNPDVKTVLAMDVYSGKVLWEVENFSFSTFRNDGIIGWLGQEEPMVVKLDLLSGKTVEKNLKLDSDNDEISDLLRPFQYQEGSSYYTTVSGFLAGRYSKKTETSVEYLECDTLIFISYYSKEKEGLTNYLLVVTEAGDELLHEKIDERLKGLGMDTFFILSGCLFFVRNKRELLSYQIL